MKHFQYLTLFVLAVGCASTDSGLPRGGDAADLQRAAARNAKVTGNPPRIAPLAQDQIPESVRGLVAELYSGVGLPPPDELSNFHSILAKSPDLMRAHLGLANYLFKGTLPVRDRELALLRTAWLTKAPYEWGEHVKVFKRLGRGTDAEVERAIVGSSAPGWTEHEQAILRGVEELYSEAMISDETWATLARTWSEPQLIEFPILVGRYVSVAYTLNSLRVRLEQDNRGLAER
jgi:4-carboxymuconolactone decarboxylase